MVKLLKFQTNHGTFLTCHNDVVFVEHLAKGIVYEEDIVFKYIISRFQKMDPTIPKVILDIGGHIGSHTVLYSKYIPNSTIYTFEPQKELYKILNMNLSVNNITNVNTFNCAVGENIGNCTMSAMLYDGYNAQISYDTDRLLNYGGITIGVGGEPIEMIPIDSLNLSACHYMKIDVEGAEALVFLGAINTIRKYKPFIMFENSDKVVTDEMKASIGIEKDRVIEDPIFILEKEGYYLTRIEGGNILAIPNESVNL